MKCKLCGDTLYNCQDCFGEQQIGNGVISILDGFESHFCSTDCVTPHSVEDPHEENVDENRA